MMLLASLRIKANLCFICDTSCDSKKEPMPWDEDHDDQCSHLKRQLSVVLLVRNILEIPLNVIESLLLAKGNPASWGLQMCSDCRRVFIEAENVHSRIVELNREFQNLANRLRSQFKVDWTSNYGDNEKEANASVNQNNDAGIKNSNSLAQTTITREGIRDGSTSKRKRKPVFGIRKTNSLKKIKTISSVNDCQCHGEDPLETTTDALRMPTKPKRTDANEYEYLRKLEVSRMQFPQNQDNSDPQEPVLIAKEDQNAQYDKAESCLKGELLLRDFDFLPEDPNSEYVYVGTVELPRSQFELSSNQDPPVLIAIQEEHDQQESQGESFENDSFPIDCDSDMDNNDYPEDPNDLEYYGPSTPENRKENLLNQDNKIEKITAVDDNSLQNDCTNDGEDDDDENGDHDGNFLPEDPNDPEYEPSVSVPKSLKKREQGIQNKWQCKFCKEAFHKRAQLRMHLRQHKSDLKKTIIKSNLPFCHQCKKKFKSIDGLKLHLRRNGHATQFPLKCDTCGEGFFEMSQLEHHNDQKHSKCDSDQDQDGRHYCSECNIEFETKAGLRSHLGSNKAHTPHLKFPYRCELCPKGFMSSFTLKDHQRHEHYEELKLEPYKCKYCGRIMSSEKSLDQHVRCQHTKETKFKCDKCDLGFMYLTIYKNHYAVAHSNEKPFLCTQCPKNFNQRPLLEDHMRVHTGEKPYDCKECGKKFSDRPTFNRHKETHGDQVHVCNHCSKEFKVWHSFRLHMKAAHKEVIYKDPALISLRRDISSSGTSEAL